MSESITDRCTGRWHGILPAFGIDGRFLTGKHGPCPMCGGRDRFRFDNKEGRGTFFCSQCGAGDGFSLLMRSKGWDFKETASQVEQIVGKVERKTSNSRERSQQQLRAAMAHLWRSGAAVMDGDPVGRYLANRRIKLHSYPSEIRFASQCRYSAGGNAASYHPAMIARVLDKDGTAAVTVHRTYLDSFGAKAALPEVRKLMPGKIPHGCAVRLAPARKVLGIAEGIETALSASIIWQVPCWAAINASMLMAWEPPIGVEQVIIFGDNDENFTGQQASSALARRLKLNRKDIGVEIQIPPDVGMDWNDVLQAERQPSSLEVVSR